MARLSKFERLRLYETPIPKVDQTLANLPNLKYFRSGLKDVTKGLDKSKLIKLNDKEKKASIKSKETTPYRNEQENKKIASKKPTAIAKNF